MSKVHWLVVRLVFQVCISFGVLLVRPSVAWSSNVMSPSLHSEPQEWTTVGRVGLVGQPGHGKVVKSKKVELLKLFKLA